MFEEIDFEPNGTWPGFCDICGSQNLVTLEENPPMFLIGCDDCGHEQQWHNGKIKIADDDAQLPNEVEG